MTADTTAAKLTELEARLAAQEAALATYRAGRATRRPRPRRRQRLVAALALALLVALVPLALLAANPFTDLDPAQAAGHNPNIDAIVNAGITKGCNPPTNDQYCPKDVVTREQMASFLARAAGLGGNPPVANAATAANAAALDGKRANEFARVAQNSRNTNSGTPINSTTFAQFFTVQIAVPANGFVLLGGTVSAVSGAATSCTASMRLRDIGGGGTSPEAHGTTPPVAFSYVTLDRAHIFPVFGAQTLTFALDVAINANPTAGCSLNFFDPTLTALYIPFGAAGTGTLQP